MVGVENWPAKYVKSVGKLNVSDSAFNVIVPLKNNSCLKKLNGAHEVILVDNLDMDDLFSRLRDGELSMVTFGDFGRIDPDFCCGGADSVVYRVVSRLGSEEYSSCVGPWTRRWTRKVVPRPGSLETSSAPL